MKEVSVSGGHIALVDDADWELVRRYRWYSLTAARSLTVYARTTVRGKTIYLHRLILDHPADGVVDHIDGNGLNNQRSNLRVLSHQENCDSGITRRQIAAWKASRKTKNAGQA